MYSKNQELTLEVQHGLHTVAKTSKYVSLIAPVNELRVMGTQRVEHYGSYMALAFLIIFPGSVVLKPMELDQVVILMAGFGLLLFYGSARGMIEAIGLYREKVWSTVELALFFFIGLPP